MHGYSDAITLSKNRSSQYFDHFHKRVSFHMRYNKVVYFPEDLDSISRNFLGVNFTLHQSFDLKARFKFRSSLKFVPKNFMQVTSDFILPGLLC